MVVVVDEEEDVVEDEVDEVDEAAGADSLEGPVLAGVSLLASPELFGFALEYKSEYHPPPLKLTAGAESTRSRCPLQCGQIVISGSENFCLFSVRSWHCVHSYS